MKRKFQFKIIVEKTEKPPVKKRKRLNTQEPLSYLFDTTFPVLSNIAFPASLNTNTIAAQKQLEQLEKKYATEIENACKEFQLEWGRSQQS